MARIAHDNDVSEPARLEMVRDQVVARGVSDERVLAAMRTLPRHEFVLPEDVTRAYGDHALPIGHGGTISQPFMVAVMLELLQVDAEHRVLEVGAGSGYQAALLGQLARDVYAVEISAPLAERARRTLARIGVANVHIVTGDGGAGYPSKAPFDRIIVAAACPSIPQPLVDQLAERGRLVAPVGGPDAQTCIVGTKHGGTLAVTDNIGCVFVPLQGEFGWR
jgi:protein-L-isoaspartate(D-aspartate) O-methyltransferase